MDKVKTEAQLHAQEQARANQIISGKRLDQWERDTLAMAKMIGQTRISVDETGTKVDKIAADSYDTNLRVSALAIDVATQQRTIESLKAWSFVRDVIIILLLVATGLCVGYNTTQFWGW